MQRAADLFISLLDDEQRAALGAPADLQPLLEHLVARGRVRWPRVDVSSEAFIVHLAARLPSGDVAERALRNFCAEDLYLTCACLLGDQGAIAALSRDYAPLIERTLRAQRLPAALVEDLRQQIFDRLLLSRDDKAPELSRYAGLGKLSAWLRVMVARVARRQLEQEKKLVPIGDEQLADRLVEQRSAASGGRRSAAELDLLQAKAQYREAFKAAFKSALAELEPRDVMLLRQRYVDELGLEGIAAIYRVHHATIHRRLDKVRVALLAQTKAHLERALSVSSDECASIIRLIQSDFDLTLQTFFRRLAPADGGGEGAAR